MVYSACRGRRRGYAAEVGGSGWVTRRAEGGEGSTRQRGFSGSGEGGPQEAPGGGGVVHRQRPTYGLCKQRRHTGRLQVMTEGSSQGARRATEGDCRRRQ